MVLYFVRAAFLLAVLALTFQAATSDDISRELGPGGKMVAFMIIPFVVGLVVVLMDIGWKRKNLRAISGVFFGVVAGLSIGYVLGLVVGLVAGIFPGGSGSGVARLVQLLVTAISVFLCVSFIVQTKDDFRFIIPYVEFAKQAKGSRPLLLDTSVIIDGRVGDMAQTRFLESALVIPRFVLMELQAIADSSDKLRRNRGRRGLDVLNRLRNSDKVDLSIIDSDDPGVIAAGNVDSKLVAMARAVGGRIMTNDYNLNKIAQLAGVDVLNVNDLANTLKTVVLPGERIPVRVIKPGEEAGQGVGYLDDGTMVVVDQGREHLGKVVTIAVTSTLQTSAGRMIFGRLEEADEPTSRGQR